jgi:hypothetical protein
MFPVHTVVADVGVSLLVRAQLEQVQQEGQGVSGQKHRHAQPVVLEHDDVDHENQAQQYVQKVDRIFQVVINPPDIPVITTDEHMCGPQFESRRTVLWVIVRNWVQERHPA